MNNKERWKCKYAVYLGCGCDINFYECMLSDDCCDGVCDKYKERSPEELSKIVED